jgi:hypothetical protein
VVGDGVISAGTTLVCIELGAFVVHHIFPFENATSKQYNIINENMIFRISDIIAAK